MTLPKIHLETFIIVPFQISKRNSKSFDASELEDALKDSQWHPLAGHPPDRITLESNNFSKPSNDIDIEKIIRYQAYNYFHPFVRQFWFKKETVKRYRHNVAHQIVIETEAQKNKSETNTFDLVCDFIYFSNDIGILSLHIKSKAEIEFKVAQKILDETRRTYPPYIKIISNIEDENNGGHSIAGGHYPKGVKILDKDGETVAESKTSAQWFLNEINTIEQEGEEIENNEHRHVWDAHYEYLLEPFCTNNNNERSFVATHLGDDRSALVNLVSVIPNKSTSELPSKWTEQIDRGNYIRLCFADAPGNDPLPYSEKYLAQFEERFCYDRFWYQNNESTDSPSRMMLCGYAFTWIGSRDDQWYFNDPTAGAPPIFSQIYTPMMIISQFQKAKLLVISRKLAEMSKYQNGRPSFKDDKFEDFTALKEDFIGFTQNYWFDEISPQEQGIELYGKLRKELALQELYDEARQEIHDIVDFIQTKLNEKISNSSLQISKIGIPIAVISIWLSSISAIFGFFGANFIDFESKYTINTENIYKNTSFAKFISFFSIQTQLLLFGLICAITIAIVGLYYNKHNKK